LSQYAELFLFTSFQKHILDDYDTVVHYLAKCWCWPYVGFMVLLLLACLAVVQCSDYNNDDGNNNNVLLL